MVKGNKRWTSPVTKLDHIQGKEREPRGKDGDLGNSTRNLEGKITTVQRDCGRRVYYLFPFFLMLQILPKGSECIREREREKRRERERERETKNKHYFKKTLPYSVTYYSTNTLYELKLIFAIKKRRKTPETLQTTSRKK